MAKLSTFVITVMLFFGIITVFFTAYGDIKANYDYTPTMSDKEAEFYGKVGNYSNDLYDISKEMQNKTESSQPKEWEAGSGYTLMTRNIWNVITIPFKIIPMIITTMSMLISIMGIPTWLGNIIFGLILTTLIFLVISLIFGKDS